MNIHPTAIIEDGARLGEGCLIHAGAIIKRCAVLGDRVVVHPYAVVGGDAQYLKFDPKVVTGVRIGSGTTIREHVTVNNGIYDGKFTIVGEKCLLMANVHLGHDCILGDEIVVANNVMLAGHVEVGNHAVIGGGAGIHQFCRIGEGAMVGGLARITKDIAPFLMAVERDEVPGFNLVGLKRRAFPRETMREIKACYAHVFAGGDPRPLAAAKLAAGVQSAEARRFLEFFAGGKRGFLRPARAGAHGDEE
jgi:UDP-N-acetylglucosamine acyltransferase